MTNLRVVRISDELIFDDGTVLSSEHYQVCCENHYLDLTHLTLDDFDGLEFDLSGDDFFERIEDYGIALKPINGFPVRIPGYYDNNGYYSDKLTLCITAPDGSVRDYDITECQG